MASLTQDFDIIETVLRNAAQVYPSMNNRTVFSFDCTNGSFALLREGWNEYQRNHFAWIHVEVQSGKLWIHRDGTEYGIANDFVAAGIPQNRIVLAYQHPTRRESGEFAVA